MSTQSSGVVSAVVTSFVAVMPNEVLTYAGKLAGVFVLALVAELGRRLIGLVWKDKGNQ